MYALAYHRNASKPEVYLLRGVDGAGGRQRDERVDGVEEALLLVRLQSQINEIMKLLFNYINIVLIEFIQTWRTKTASQRKRADVLRYHLPAASPVEAALGRRAWHRAWAGDGKRSLGNALIGGGR